jgi:hypothetical protein
LTADDSAMNCVAGFIEEQRLRHVTRSAARAVR